MEVNYFLIYRNRYVTQLESLMPSFMLLLFVASDSSATPWSLPCSSVHGISQSSILEWFAIFLARESHPGSNPSLLFGRWILYHWVTRKAHLHPANKYLLRACQAMLQVLGLSQSSRDKMSVLLELKFSWRSWKASQSICNEISVLIHAKEKSEAELEEELADGIINNGQYILIYYKFCEYWLI